MDMRFISAAAFLAGALALAGCGGNGTPAKKEDPKTCPAGYTGTPGDCVKPSETDPSKPMRLVMPTGSTWSFKDGDKTQGTIPVGKKRPFGNVEVSCPADAAEACGWEVRDGGIYATFGATAALMKTETVPDRSEADNDDRNAGVDGDRAPNSDWLSNSALIAAVKQQVASPGDYYVEIKGPRGTPQAVLTSGNAQLSNGGDFSNNPGTTNDDGSEIGHLVIDVGGGNDTDVRLVHTRGRTAPTYDEDQDPTKNDYLVYGAWETRTSAAGGDLDPRLPPKNGVLWTGSIRRTDSASWANGDARYEGKALGHYATGADIGKKWEEWDGNVDLRANFTQNIIKGQVTTGLTASNLGTVNLEQTMIRGGNATGGTGLIELLDDNGDAIAGSTGSGKWNAGFFGSDINGQPNGIAGDFAVERKTGTAAVLHGAFGGHHIGDLDQQP